MQQHINTKLAEGTLILISLMALAGIMLFPSPIIAQTPADNTPNEEAAESSEVSNYSYTVQPGDGVTHMLINLAEQNDRTLSAREAYEVAKDNGQRFLELGITVPMNAPYTDGIGGFPTPGAVVQASTDQSFFEKLQKDVQTVAGTIDDNQDAANSDGSNDTDGDEAADDNSDSENADDNGEVAADDNFNWWWIALLAVVLGTLYYLFSRQSTDIE